MYFDYYKTLQQQQAQQQPNFQGPPSPGSSANAALQLPPQPIPVPETKGGFFARGGGFSPTPEQQAAIDRGGFLTQEAADTYANQQRQGRNKGLGNMLMALSDAFGGRPIEAGVQQRQQYQQQQNEIDKKKAQYEAILNDPNTAPATKKLLESLGWQNMDAFLMKKFEMDNRVPTKPDMLRLGIYDTSGNQVGTVLRSNIEKIAEMEGQGYLVGNLSSPQTTPKGSDNDDKFDVVFNRQRNTGQLINMMNDTAQQMYDEPKSGLRIGTTAQFVDGIIKNVDAGLDLIGRKEDSENWKEYASKGISGQGNDFSSRINEVSRETGVIESKIRDLAYLFAAARGQEGRGLSDKDYENALTIVSGGVGAENRVAVLQDVAQRFRSQALYDLGFMTDYYSDNPDMMARFNKIPGLPTFINPFGVTVQQSSSSATAQSVNDPLGIRTP